MKNESDTNIDLTLVKNLISSIPNERYVESADNPTKRPPQDMVDTAYDSLLMDLATAIDCQCFYSPYTTSREKIGEFLDETLKTDKLQTTNVLLTSKLWRDVVLSKKQDMQNGILHRSVDEENFRINFSEVSATVVDKNRITNPVLTTIQFDFDNNPDGTLSAIDKTAKAKTAFRKLIRELESTSSVDEIYEIADKTRDFSIHKYYIPHGFSTKATDECCLLLRYDHCSAKHRNGSMPALYREIFPEYVEEPHFHFTNGFGSVYKLSNDGATHNYGVGYAIGITALKNYLIKLKSGSYSSRAEQRLYTENDFGMPFLHLLGGGSSRTSTDLPPSNNPTIPPSNNPTIPPSIHINSDLTDSNNTNGQDSHSAVQDESSTTIIDKIIEQLTLLEKAYKMGNKSAEIQFAYNVTNLISSCPTKSLSLEKNLSNSTLSNSDNFINIYCNYILNQNEEVMIKKLEMLAEKGQVDAIEYWYKFKKPSEKNVKIEKIIENYTGKNLNENLILIYKLYDNDKKNIQRIYEDLYDIHNLSIEFKKKYGKRDKSKNPYAKKEKMLIEALRSMPYAQQLIKLATKIKNNADHELDSNISKTLLDLYISEPLIISKVINKRQVRLMMQDLQEYVIENPKDTTALFTLGKAYSMLGANKKEKDFGNSILTKLSGSKNNQINTEEETLTL